MKPVIKRRPDRRLARLIRLPGGKTIAQIEADVEARLGTLRGSCAGTIRDMVSEMGALAAAMPRPPGPEELGCLYRLSNEIIGLCGVADMEDLGRVAMSFCHLLDAQRCGGAWSADSFDVHMQTLKLLAAPDGELNGDARSAIVNGLDQVVKRALG
jgi:hypothetical protein